MITERKIDNFLKEIGTPCDLKGYEYIIDAIKLLFEDYSKYSYVTKNLYPQVARDFNTTASRVERAIRHAIERTWETGNITFINECFGSVNYFKGKPTNTQFVCRLYRELKYREDGEIK